ncbi:MAG: aminotransferase class IV [Planctomycetota bacterium]
MQQNRAARAGERHEEGHGLAEAGNERRNVWIWCDGAIRPRDEAKVDVFDRGLLYGDSIYETLRTYNGRFFELDAHLERLEGSAAAIGLQLPWGRSGISAVLDELVAARPAGHEAGVRLTITRGSGPLGLDPSHCTEPRLIGYGWPIEPGRHPLAASGIDIVVTAVRRNPPNALDPSIKSGNFLNNILAYQEARQRGAFEGVLLTVDGAVAECTTSNLFWVHDGELHTAPDEGILLGVTRAKILELAAAAEIPHALGSYPPQDLLGASEAFLTSTLKGVLPVRRVDERPLSACPGPITQRLQSLYDEVTLN